MQKVLRKYGQGSSSIKQNLLIFSKKGNLMKIENH